MGILARRRQAACSEDFCAIMANLPKEQRYLHVIPVTDGTITIKIQSAVSTTNCGYIAYSNNCGKSWTTVNNVDNQEVLVNIPVIADKPTYIKGTVNNANSNSDLDCTVFVNSGPKFEVGGNIASISFEDNFVDKSLGARARKLFLSCKRLTSAANLYLPVTGMYSSLFNNCTQLTAIPRFVVNSLSAYSMTETFRNNKITECTIISKGNADRYWSSNLFDGVTTIRTLYLYAPGYTNWNAIANALTTLQTTAAGTVHLGGTFWDNHSYLGIPSNWTIERWQTSDIPELNN